VLLTWHVRPQLAGWGRRHIRRSVPPSHRSLRRIGTVWQTSRVAEGGLRLAKGQFSPAACWWLHPRPSVQRVL